MVWRDQFHIPLAPNGESSIYLCGNSLGLQHKEATNRVAFYLNRWATDGVEGWFDGELCWYAAADRLKPYLAQIVGGSPKEVALTASLTTNLHLMLASFYRPQGKRTKILIDSPTFPSDLYAINSHLQLHGHNPKECVISVTSLEDAERVIKSGEIALILFNGVNFLTGEHFDMQHLTEIGHQHGCLVGFDLAHAVGNVPLELHAWNVDFAVWCHYKYLCGGPGAVGGLFVHEKHGAREDLGRMAGWWGNDPKRRFQMQLQPEFTPQTGAAGWELSAAPFLSMAPLEASLPLIAGIGMSTLRTRSLELTARLSAGLKGIGATLITPEEPERRGCQLTIQCEHAEIVLGDLKRAGVICDFRPPSMIRVAPKPLYNSIEDVDAFVEIFESVLQSAL